MSAYKKGEIKAEILKKLDEKGLKSPVYKSQVDQFLKLYDQLETLNQKEESLKDSQEHLRQYLACLAESRQLQKRMQSILDWLGIKPTNDQEKDFWNIDL